jgi:hypothetical protein
MLSAYWRPAGEPVAFEWCGMVRLEAVPEPGMNYVGAGAHNRSLDDPTSGESQTESHLARYIRDSW